MNVDDGDVPAKASGFRGSGEYLLWWVENGRVPPLVTAGGDGVLDSSGTQVLLDDLDFDGDPRHGGRFALSYQFATTRSIGVEATFFFLSDRQSDVSFSSSGDPVLGRRSSTSPRACPTPRWLRRRESPRAQ